MTKYRAEIKPLNAAKIGTEAHGYVEFTTEGDNLHIKLEMFDTPANIQHWEHFHGFPDGKDASIPTEAQDVNHDGYSYEKDVPLAKLEAKFKEVFHDQALALDKRVVYVHGVPAELELPATVAGKLNDKYEQHVTLPIAAGKIERLD